MTEPASTLPVLEPVNPIGQPQPIPEEPAFEVAELQEDMLPKALWDMVHDVADRMQAPIDYIAVSLLCGLASIIGRKAVIYPKQQDDWHEAPNLWGAIIGPPSARKSPAMKAALQFVEAIEEDQKRDFEARLEAWNVNAELIAAKKTVSQKEVQLALKNNDEERAKKLITDSRQAADKPPTPRLTTNNATVEKLGELLNENPNGLLIVRDELSGLIKRISQEEHQDERAFYLECYKGYGPYTFDRIGRGTVRVENCILSLLGGIQPAKIGPLVRSVIRGDGNDGLLQRFQLAVWPNLKKEFRYNDRKPDLQARQKVEDIARRLYAMPMPKPGEKPKGYHFDADAQKMFIQWLEENENKARSGEESNLMESYRIKLTKTVVSLALIFALIDDDAEGELVKASSLAMALEWADYLLTHAKKLYAIGETTPYQGARLIIARRSQLPEKFTPRDVQRKGWAGLDEIEDVKEALECLVEYGHITAIESDKTTGRPSTHYAWLYEKKGGEDGAMA